MAKVAKNTNAYIAHKIAKNTLKILPRVLVFVGKPIYFAIIIVLLILSSIGNIVIFTFKTITVFLKKIVKFLTKIKLPKFSIKLPVLRLRLKIITLSKKFKFFKPKKTSLKFSPITMFLFVLIIVCGFIFWQKILRDLPNVDNLASRKIDISTKIYDRNGILLYKIYKDENRTPIPLKDIPDQVKLATIAIEDAEFYSHSGFSLRGILRSFIKNAQKGELVGGSTITQQLVKNALLSPEKTWSRKIKELILSVQVERKYSKDQILEMYLNEVSYGGTAYGIQEAANVYFNKNAKDLNLPEAALLAGLPKSPSRYSPFSDAEAAIGRQKEVLHLMKVNKFITANVEGEAINEKINFSENKIDIKAPHFVMYVKKLLAEKYGEEAVETGGLEVVTTLDYQIQELAEKAVSDEVGKLKNLRVGNGAAVVLDPKNGEILAMVGSKDYFDTKNDGQVNVALRLRQPGSSIKVVNYAYALEHGYTPSSIINDSPTSFNIAGQLPYAPKNYDGKYRGNITLRSALAESRNIPAVKILAGYGVSKMIDLGQKMGITSWTDKNRFGLSLTLGGGEVRLLDLAQVYATIANFGKRPNITPFISIKNSEGKLLKNNCETANSNELNTVYASETPVKCPQEEVLDSRVSYLLIDILKDNNARTPAFGSNSQLVVSKHPEVAVKTGTSNDLRDNLTVGFNQNYLVAVWVGNNNNIPMSRIASGITGAAPIWNKIISGILSNTPSVAWETPNGVEKIGICTLTGTLPCNGCPTRSEFFLSENKPTKTCSSEALENIKNPVKANKAQVNAIGQFSNVP